jgi:hypothetical protein
MAPCWAHARRKFFDLARLNKAPIAIEREINGMSIVDRWRVRQERSRPLVEATRFGSNGTSPRFHSSAGRRGAWLIAAERQALH